MRRTGVSVLGWVLLVAGVLASAVLLILRLVTELHTWHHHVIAISSFMPLLWIPVLVGCLGLLLVLRARWRLLGAAVLIAAMTVFAWPLLPQEERSDIPLAVGSTLTVLSLNLQFGRADIDEVSELITADVDVLALQEYTPGFEEELAAVGVLEEFPHQVGTSDTDASGTMLLSRTPVERVARAEGTAFENLIATTTVEGTDWHLGVIHTAPPQMGTDAWAHDGAAVKDLSEPYLGENLLLVGDFNAIDQHHTMRELTADGDLHDLAARRQGEGTGWHPTWPTGTWIPSFARIDHALVSGGVLGDVPQYETVTGSDHKALLVEVLEVV
ncbi:endonuclease/exonuclease/phosphatase family protein [uncultured Brachybacterium sp.]|uniref:endonuclease/exonuclease/phosphatase family protein n=1 Tax=uncultured Brachybacterium sp. TaxID=189680 RepID=UPI00261191B8|nr:endonuclease/exonuclease/phosphatase family protein [uncultured Brachybacterium sp.]